MRSLSSATASFNRRDTNSRGGRPLLKVSCSMIFNVNTTILGLPAIDWALQDIIGITIPLFRPYILVLISSTTGSQQTKRELILPLFFIMFYFLQASWETAQFTLPYPELGPMQLGACLPSHFVHAVCALTLDLYTGIQGDLMPEYRKGGDGRFPSARLWI